MAVVISDADSRSQRRSGVRGIVSFCIRRLVLMYSIHSERRELGRMSDEMLLDAGISRAQAVEESRRHFTDIPDQRY